MGEGEETLVAAARSNRSARRMASVAALSLLAMLLVGALIVWLTREQIADSIIADQIATYDLPASYEIESIGPAEQVLTNVVIGDPDNPDLTIERAVVGIGYSLGVPEVASVELIRLRLFGRLEDGVLSFGALDAVIYAESDTPSGLPALDLKLVDARGRIDTPYGALGLKAEGQGALDDGFKGIVAAIAPGLTIEGCALGRTTFYGSVAAERGAPQVSGPLRLASLNCEEAGIASGATEWALDLSGDDTLDGGELAIGGRLDTLRLPGAKVRSGALTGDASLRDGRIVARFESDLKALAAAQVSLREVAIDGSFRSDTSFAALQSDVELRGEGLALEPAMWAGLQDTEEAMAGTMIAPLLKQLQGALARQIPGGSLAADATIRRAEGMLTVVAPRVTLRNGAGATLAALSRLQVQADGAGLPRISGNVSTGGQGLPRIAGRMERDGAGNAVFRLQMAPYAAQGSQVALPNLEVRQARAGPLTFVGELRADGPLPGGEARALSVPLSGTIANNGSVRMWERCTPVSFARLRYFELALDSDRLTLCPPSGAPILGYGSEGLRIAAGAPSLEIAGSLAGTPLTLSTGAVGMAWPGRLVARSVDIAIGPDDNAARFAITELQGELGESLSGRFSEADIRLDAVPLDVLQASGVWSYQGGVLSLSEGAFVVEDRQEDDLFNPLKARDATLRLVDNVITASADLREPISDRVVTRLALKHDLATAVGFADLDVSGVQFDGSLQPVELTALALGVIAEARGTVRGSGRIDWTEDTITSSGRFRTDDFDFAAAFGPVEGVSGTIEFTDLLNLETAPGQTLSIASINPGIEANDGELTFHLRNGEVLDVAGAQWPWLGGTLSMRPVELNFTRPEVRRYTFEIVGLDAAQFIERLEMSNLAASGTFDGTISVVFDELGNGFIEDGVLLARAPGGNVSYVGDLTYEDMGAIANFAFQSLRSLDFQQMRVGVDGPLTGEVVTRLSFDGVSQGEGASSNFVTRRIAKLPIRFNVNIRAPFYQLLSNMRSLYDPNFVRDPRELGILQDDGTRFFDPDVSNSQPPIQDPESEDTP